MKYICTDKAFYKEVAHIALPIAGQSLITVGVNLTDNLMLGMLSEQALSGATMANEFVNLFQILCMGLGMGASVMTARYYGAGNQTSLKKTITLMYRFCFLFIILFTAAVAFAPKQVMQLYSNNAAIVESGTVYFQWSVPRFLLQGFTLTTTLILRSTRQVKFPLVVAVAAFLFNMAMDYLLIFGSFGFPAMGVAGAALATILARSLECIAIMGFFLFHEKRIQYCIKDFFRPCFDLFGEYVRVSLPVLISDTLLGLGNSVVSMEIGHISQSFVVANSITNTARQLSTVLTQGVGHASAILVGNTLGRGETERVRRQGNAFLGIGAFIGIAGGLVTIVMSNFMVGFYSLSAESFAVTKQLIYAQGLLVLFQSTNSILTKGVLRGGGDTRFLMVADVLFLWVLSIPLGLLAGFVWGFTPFWTYLCMKADQFFKNGVAIFRLNSGKWIQSISGAVEVKKEESL